MWYVESRNGGCYSHLRNESPAPYEMQVVINNLIAKGVKFYVHHIDYEYSGGYGYTDCLINDETLETITVHDSTAFGCYGKSHFWIEEVNQDFSTRVVYDERYGITDVILAGEFNNCLNKTVLCLPTYEDSKMYSLASELQKANMLLYTSYTMPKLLESGIFSIEELNERLPSGCAFDACLEFVKNERKSYPYSWIEFVEISINSRLVHPTWEEEKSSNMQEDDVIIL